MALVMPAPAPVERTKTEESPVVRTREPLFTERATPLMETDEVQRKIELIHTVIEPVVSGPAHSRRWMELCELTRVLLEKAMWERMSTYLLNARDERNGRCEML